MASPEKSKYDMREAQFLGGFAETVNGNQIGSIANNSVEAPSSEAHIYGSENPKSKASDKSPKHTKRLLAFGAAMTALVSSVAVFSDNLNEIFDDILDLSEKAGSLENSGNE